MFTNFLSGMLIETFFHIPICYLNYSSYLFLWLPGYAISSFMIALVFFFIYDTVKNKNRDKDKDKDISLQSQTLLGVVVSFVLLKTFLILPY